MTKNSLIVDEDGSQAWYVDDKLIKLTDPCPIRAQAIAMERDMKSYTQYGKI